MKNRASTSWQCLAWLWVCAAWACSAADSGARDMASTGGPGPGLPVAGAAANGGSGGGSAGSGGSSAGSGGGSAGSGGSIPDQIGDDDDPLLGGMAPPGAGAGGCQKVDFLFVVDNSGSMGDEQQNLANSFPGFIDAIRTTISAQDYQILVTDTDAAGGTGSSSTCSNGVCTCSPAPSCCDALCMQGGVNQCNGYACGGAPPPASTEACDATLGAGKVLNGNNMRCLPDNGRRYMIDSDPDLDTSFTCVAAVGVGGDGSEQPMAAITQAVGPQAEPGQCNAGFVRDDALLVVTFITDEEEDPGKSPGDPADWAASLLAAKGGNQDAIVVVGFFGDNDRAGGVCQAGGLTGNEGADPGYRLREFVELFDHGVAGSVCAADFAPSFSAAVGVIDQACDTVVL